MSNYRNKIYERYASVMQDATPIFDEAEAKRWGRAYVSYLRGWLPERKDASILEVGCGRGLLLYFLKSRGYINLNGVDISAEQIMIAKQVTDNISQGDATQYLNNHLCSFDLIIGIDVIEHFRKDEVIDFLDACYKALKPRGRLVLQTPNAESPWGMMHRYGDFTHEIAFNPNSLKRLLTLCGFTEIEARETGPAIHGVVSLVRFLLWKVIHRLLALWNLVEKGDIGSGIYTRVFIISGLKQSG